LGPRTLKHQHSAASAMNNTHSGIDRTDFQNVFIQVLETPYRVPAGQVL
jgi:hypothetical protein